MHAPDIAPYVGIPVREDDLADEALPVRRRVPLTKELLADVCFRLDAKCEQALQAAERVTGHHEVLTLVGLVVEATTTETRLIAM